jgi:hypothetical protein
MNAVQQQEFYKKQNMEISNHWVGLEGEQSGHPFLVRVREDLQPLIEAKEYTHRVDILWKYEGDEEAFMPDDAIMNEMDKVEDVLVVFLENDLQAILSFVYMGNHQKVWYWYSKDITETAKRINGALADFGTLPVELFAHEDPEWEAYMKVISKA